MKSKVCRLPAEFSQLARIRRKRRLLAGRACGRSCPAKKAAGIPASRHTVRSAARRSPGARLSDFKLF